MKPTTLLAIISFSLAVGIVIGGAICVYTTPALSRPHSIESNMLSLEISDVQPYRYKHDSENVSAGDEGIQVTLPLSTEQIEQLNLGEKRALCLEVVMLPVLRDWELTTVLETNSKFPLVMLDETRCYIKALWPDCDHSQDHVIHVLLHKKKETNELKNIQLIKWYLKAACTKRD